MKMQNILIKNKFFILLLCLIGFVSCESDDNSQLISGTNSIVDYLKAQPNFSLFSKAVQRVGLEGTLDGNAGTYTVLVPDDEAMQAYLQTHQYNSVEAVPMTKLTRLVNYHILEVLTPESNFVTGYLTTLARLPINDSVNVNLSLYVNAEDSLTFNDIAHIVDADIAVDNGVLHEINHTLALPTLQTFMAADDNLKPYYELLTAPEVQTDFDNILADTTRHYTFLTPNALAVEAFESGEGSQLSPEEREAIYHYQWLDTMYTSKMIKTGYMATHAHETYSGNDQALSLYVNTETGVLLNGKAGIAVADLMTINGNIQVIDSVLTLPTLATFVKADTEFDVFATQLVRDDQQGNAYMSILNASTATTNSEAPLTVFAPTNIAFDDVISELYPEQVMEPDSIPAAEMSVILNLHIIPQQSLRSEAFTNQNLQTLGGTVVLDANEKTLTDPAQRKAPISVRDAQATNGVLQAVERVLLPN